VDVSTEGVCIDQVKIHLPRYGYQLLGCVLHTAVNTAQIGQIFVESM